MSWPQLYSHPWLHSVHSQRQRTGGYVLVDTRTSKRAEHLLDQIELCGGELDTPDLRSREGEAFPHRDACAPECINKLLRTPLVFQDAHKERRGLAVFQ